MIKVLVTGANGQLAKTIEELFNNNEESVSFTFVAKNDLDIVKKKNIEGFFSKNKYDYCINCAAYTNVEQAEHTPEIAFKINAEGAKNLAQSCKETNTVLIHISTDYVFDGEKKEPYTEYDDPNPINQYGASKLLGEKYIQEILSNYFIVRTSWLYSKKYGHNFYKTILKKAKIKKEFFVTNEQIGCPTDTVSLSNFIFDLIITKSKKYGLKHFCDSKMMTWYDFAKSILVENEISEQLNLVCAKKYVTFAERPKNSMLLNSK